MQPTAMTEGQRLGESLTEGTNFQELTTDKFTEKKTGLQKQIENAENAFRAYQGDEIANQVQSYIPPEETLKIKQELGFDEKMSNVGSNFVNRLERFAPNTALAVGQTLTTLLGEDYGGEAYRMITGGIGNPEIHRMEAFDKLAKLDAEYKYSKGLIQSVQDLDLGGVAAGITDAVGSLVSTIITSATTAGTITSQANSATITAASTNTANQIVLRDASGNFSAGTITATLTGNISGNTTNAKIGIVQKIYHNDSVAPTFNPSGWVKLCIGTYRTSTLNVIYAEWISGTRIEYWITQ
jgi:hypothetical protein